MPRKERVPVSKDWVVMRNEPGVRGEREPVPIRLTLLGRETGLASVERLRQVGVDAENLSPLAARSSVRVRVGGTNLGFHGVARASRAGISIASSDGLHDRNG